MCKDAVAVYFSADPCRVSWQRKSPAVDTLLALVVFIKLQYVGIARMGMVSFLQRERKKHYFAVFSLAWLLCGVSSGHWARTLPIPHLGVLAVLLGWADMRSTVSVAQIAAGCAFGIGNRACSDETMGQPNFRGLFVPGSTLWKNGKRHAVTAYLLPAWIPAMLVSAFLYAHKAFSFYKGRCGHDARLFAPRTHCFVHKRTGYPLALLFIDRRRDSICDI